MSHTYTTLPPFTKVLLSIARRKRSDFDTPGHHSGEFFRLLPEGAAFYEGLGRGMFDADISDSSSAIGDPSSHEGVSGEAEALASSVWGSDRCFFVLAGTSTSNRIAAAAAISKGDLVLFDRNNHKSTYQGALLEAGGVPVYLESERNRYGIIGGLTERALDERTLQKKAAVLSPEAAKRERPFRLACLQLATYDGLFLNAREILRRLGPLCDYILFDGAWAGYENFLPLLKDSAVLTFPLTKEDPGLLVTQSVHKQLAGFSQTSQLHKKDSHLKGKPRYIPDDVMQDSFLSHISTSPYYPLFAGLEMNAFLHKKAGPQLWQQAEKRSIHLKKEILKRCTLLRPFLPPVVEGRPWAEHATKEIEGNARFYEITPDAPWHGFSHIPRGLYMTDPCKTLVITGALDEGAEGIPASLISAYLEAHHITAEKCDFYTLLFLNEPGDTKKKNRHLVKRLAEVETAYRDNTPLSIFLPGLPHEPGEGVRDFSRRYHAFLLEHQALSLQQALFSEDHFPAMALAPREAHEEFLRVRRKGIPLWDAGGKTALENVLPYPPGIVVLTAGEVWTKEILSYFLFLEAYGKAFPAFQPEIVGVHRDEKGEPYVWVRNQESRGA